MQALPWSVEIEASTHRWDGIHRKDDVADLNDRQDQHQRREHSNTIHNSQKLGAIVAVCHRDETPVYTDEVEKCNTDIR